MAKSKPKQGDVLPGTEEATINDPVVRAFEDAAGGTERLTAFDLRVRLFLFYYVQSYDASWSARKMGVAKTSSKQVGHRYLKHEKTQALLREMTHDLEEEIEFLRRQTLSLALREATNDEMCPGSQGARVKAIDLLGKFLGMHTQNVNLKAEGPPGVLAVPFASTHDEWESLARASQDAVMSGDIAPMPEKPDLTVEENDDLEDPLNVL
jgi:hypothetical protein